MRYEVGDVVRIREDLVVGASYTDDEGCTWVYESEMKEAVVRNNYIATIIKASHTAGFRQEYYKLDISDRPFFNDGMIEGYALDIHTDDMLNILGV